MNIPPSLVLDSIHSEYLARRQHLVLPLEISSLEPADGLHLASFRIGHPLEVAALGGAAIILGVVGYILVSLLVHIIFAVERRLSLSIEC